MSAEPLQNPTLKRERRTPWEVPFLESLARTGNVSASADAASVHRSTVYEHAERHPDFAEEWETAVEIAVDALELEARRRAFEGTEEPVFYKGQQCGKIRKYSDTLLIFLLKAHRPQK